MKTTNLDGIKKGKDKKQTTKQLKELVSVTNVSLLLKSMVSMEVAG